MNASTLPERASRTKGREATLGVIPGRFALAVGRPNLPEPRGWKWTALSTVAQLESGHTPSRKHPEYWDGGVPWVSIQDAVANHGRAINDTSQHISALGLENSSARLLPARTVCLSRTASVGYVVIMAREMATSQDFVNWVCGPKLEPDFLKYVLLAERDSLLRFASGTTHQTIYYPEAKAFHVLLPPKREQQAILAILCALDNRIELNWRMNRTLEGMAQALFKSWFVDFEPVHALAAAKKPFGMDAATAAAFPEELVQSEDGPIPKGWTVERFETFAARLTDGAHESPESVESGKPMASVKDLTPWGIDLRGARMIGEVDFARLVATGCQPKPGDVLLAKDGARCLETVCEYRQSEEVVVLSSVAIIRPRTAALSGFLATWLSLPETRRYLREGFLSGSAIPRVVLKDLKRARMISPSERVIELFDRSTLPHRSRILQNVTHDRTLASLRNTLLPKLLSGELRIKDAEKLVGEAT